MRRLACAGTVLLVLLQLAAGLAQPAADPGAQAAAVRALLERARDAGPRERVLLLKDALTRLEVAGEIEGLERATIERALARARTAPVLTIDCARAEDHACLLERAGALIDEHRLLPLRDALGREQARWQMSAASANVRALDRAGDWLGGSAVVAAMARAEVARGRRAGAAAVIRERTRLLLELAPEERVHRLLNFGANLVGDGLAAEAVPVFAAAEREAQAAIEAVPPSDAAEAVLQMYRAQALAGQGRSEAALELMGTLTAGPLEGGWVALAFLLGKLAEPAAVGVIAARFEDDWRINTAQVEAYARAGRYQSAVDLARTTNRASNRWVRLRVVAQAMAARGDGEPAARVLRALEEGMQASQMLGLAGLWREIGRMDEAGRLRTRFLRALQEDAGARLAQPVASAEEAEAVAGWTLQLAHTLEAP